MQEGKPREGQADIFAPLFAELEAEFYENRQRRLAKVFELSDEVCLIEEVTGEPCGWAVCSVGDNSGGAGKILEVDPYA